MKSSVKNLADLLDGLGTSGGAIISESAASVTASNLSADAARSLVSEVEAQGWSVRVENETGEAEKASDLDDDFGPFRVIFNKPAREDGALCIVSLQGFKDALAQGSDKETWQVAGLIVGFATGLHSISPWGGGQIYSASGVLKSPRTIVRCAGSSSLLPTDLRSWMLRGEMSEDGWKDPYFKAFVDLSTPRLIAALSNELVEGRVALFSGPPRLEFDLNDQKTSGEAMVHAYRQLRDAVAWVYEDPAATEQRHILFAAEYARQSKRGEAALEVFDGGGKSVLEGARMAFALSISEVGREALKTQQELRKAVADDSMKSSEAARGLATSIVASVSTSIATIAAASKGVADPSLLHAILLAVSIYLLVISLTSFHHLSVQREIRAAWRKRFFRFITDDDYNEMVLGPLHKAERPARLLSGLAALVAVLMAIYAIFAFNEVGLEQVMSWFEAALSKAIIWLMSH